MTFLQPFVLFGLPLVLTPVIIHLLNRLRHRPKPWAAMRFLVSATRSTTARSKLRQFLILACRVLAVAALIFFVARPLAGGWLGWALSSAPDAILILLDRSASMETQNNGTSRRQEAIQMLTQAAGQFEETSHLILIDSVTRAPQEISRATNLAQLPITAPATPPPTFRLCFAPPSIGWWKTAPARRRFGSPRTTSGATGSRTIPVGKTCLPSLEAFRKKSASGCSILAKPRRLPTPPFRSGNCCAARAAMARSCR